MQSREKPKAVKTPKRNALSLLTEYIPLNVGALMLSFF